MTMTPRTPMLRQNLDWSGATNKDVFEYFGTEVIREWKVNSLSNIENEARVYIHIVLGTNFEAVSTIEYNDRPFSKFATFIGRDIDEVIFKMCNYLMDSVVFVDPTSDFAKDWLSKSTVNWGGKFDIESFTLKLKKEKEQLVCDWATDYMKRKGEKF